MQSLLITIKNRHLHMKLGWSAVGLGVVIATTGVMVAIRFVQGAPDFDFFGMAYPDFLLVMFAEIAAFTAFLATGLVTRKRPQIHRSMMLLASLSLLLGATARMPLLEAVFPGHGLVSFFGPVFVLAAIFLLVHSLMMRRLDRGFATGCAVMVVTYLAAEQLSRTGLWHQMAAVVLRT